MNVLIKTIDLAKLAEWQRDFLDHHRSEILDSLGGRQPVLPHGRTAAQDRGWSFWKVCFNGHLVEILKQAHGAEPGCLGKLDPWIFETDLESLRSECSPGSAVSKFKASDPVPSVEARLSALETLIASKQDPIPNDSNNTKRRARVPSLTRNNPTRAAKMPA